MSGTSRLPMIGLFLMATAAFPPTAQAACPGDTQTQMNICAANDYAQTDKELNSAWRKLQKSEALIAAQHAEAVVVGSAIVNRIAELGRSPSLVPEVSRLVRSLAEALHSSANR